MKQHKIKILQQPNPLRGVPGFLALAAFAGMTSIPAHASVALSNGSFETTGTLYNGALGGLYEAPPWVNLSTGTPIQASSVPATKPPNGEIGAFGPSPFPGVFTGSRYLRLNGDTGAVGATAQTLGTMQSGHTYTITANVIGVCSVGNAFSAQLRLVSNASTSPTTTYATATVAGLANGGAVVSSVSYTATAGDDGSPLVVLINSYNPPGGVNYAGGIDNVQLTDALPAAPLVWTGGGSVPFNWNDGSNWGGTAPVGDGSDGTLHFVGGLGLSNSNNFGSPGSPAKFGGIVFESGADAFSLGGTAIALGGNVVNDSGSPQMINLGLSLVGATRTFNAAAGDIAVSQPIIDGDSSRGIIKTGNATLSLMANNTYSGNTTVSAGTLDVAAGGVISNAGPISTGSGGTLQVNGSVTCTGHYYIGAGTAGSGTNIVNSGGTLNVGGSGLWLNIGGKLVGGGGSIGNGTFTINGGSVNIAAGTTWYFNPYGASAPGTLNLDGGTLSTAATLTDGAGSGSSVNFNGGIYQFTASTTLPFNGALSLNVKEGGAVLDTGSNNVSVGYGDRNTPLLHSGSGTDGGLTKLGAGTLTLIRANTYNGATTISNGTLALSSSGSLNSGSSVSIAAGATLDVSAYASYTWGAGASLTASGTTDAAILKGGATGVDLGSRPTTLNFAPATFTGDSSRPALNVSAGTLNLDTTTITVNNNAATPLSAGDYTLITGTVSGTPTLNPVIGGAGLAAYASASLQFSGGNLILHVEAGFSPTTTVLALHRPSTSSSTYGDALQFTVTVTGNSPTGTVSVKDGGVSGTPLGTGTLSGGSTIVTLDPLNALTAGTHTNIVAVYSGDGSNTGSVSAALGTQTVAKKELTLPDATAQSKLYDGNASASLTGTLAGVLSSDTVTVTMSGNFADATPGTGKSVSSTSTIDEPSQANYTLTQPTGLTADIVAFTWTNSAGGDWSTATNWLDNLVGDGVGTTSFFSTLDITTDTTVHLDSPKTGGTLIFGDTDTGTAAGWLLDNSGSPDNTLTLAGSTPTITVNALAGGKAVTISTAVAGTSGLTKNGTGNLILAAANTYSGATTVRGGTLDVAAGGVIDNAGPINAVGGGSLNISGTVHVTNGVLAVGSSNAGTGTMNILPGAVVNVVNGAQTSNVYVGGKINNGGSIGLGVLNISGTLNVSAGSYAGVNGDGSAIWLNPYGRSGNSTLNLNSGGLLNTARPVAEGAVANGSIFNFDGGTLKSTYTVGSILQNSIYNVRNGGAIIDSASTNISLSFPLLHSSIGGDHAVDGGLTKTGNGTLTLSAVNTYTGNTTVNAGTLSITHACLADASTVTIASTAKLDLNFGSVSDTVANLIIGATVMPAGNYGATGSGATTIDDTHFSGVGTLTVTSGGGYASWANDQGLTGGPGSELDPAFNADPNKDGIQNGMAWILGAGALGDPAANLRKLPAVTRDGSGALVLSFDRLASSAASATLVVQCGDDLSGWTGFTVGTSGGTSTEGSISVAVALTAGATTDYDRITVTIPATYMTAHPKTFARLMATE